MSTAITNFGKTYDGCKVKPVNSKRAVQYVKVESKKTRVLRAAKKTLLYTFLLTLLLTVAGVAGFYYYYNQYSAIVDRRISSGFWHSRAGVYSAPFILRKDQKTTLENVV